MNAAGGYCILGAETVDGPWLPRSFSLTFGNHFSILTTLNDFQPHSIRGNAECHSVDEQRSG
jgi:hypothetical protein